MEWIIRDLEYQLYEQKDVLEKYKRLKSKRFANAAQQCVDDLTQAISILKAGNKNKS